MDISLAFKILEQGLKLWNTKEGKEYLEKFIKLKEAYYAELDKRSSGRRYSQLKLDRIMRDIELIGEAFTRYAPSVVTG